MKKKILSTVIVASMALASMSGCSLFDKANKECTELGDNFMDAILSCDADDIAELTIDEDEALEILADYALDNEFLVAILDNASFEAGSKSCSTKKGEGEIEYTVIIPDYEEALDEDPEDMDELIDLLEDVDTIEITTTIEFELGKKDKWYVSNIEDVLDDIMGDILDTELPFANYDELIDHVNWYWTDSGNDTYYSTWNSMVELDIWTTSEGALEAASWNLHYDVYYNGNLIIENSDNYYVSSSGTYIETYCDEEDVPSYSGDGMPVGTYRIVVMDNNGCVLADSTCTVIDY
ncbi:MAG: hypothetical protein MJ094_05005 [Saccharofermentans sp.]|nr:hypothetical protein [Saccharofermentans sp.]